MLDCMEFLLQWGPKLLSGTSPKWDLKWLHCLVTLSSLFKNQSPGQTILERLLFLLVIAIDPLRGEGFLLRHLLEVIRQLSAEVLPLGSVNLKDMRAKRTVFPASGSTFLLSSFPQSHQENNFLKTSALLQFWVALSPFLKQINERHRIGNRYLPNPGTLHTRCASQPQPRERHKWSGIEMLSWMSTLSMMLQRHLRLLDIFLTCTTRLMMNMHLLLWEKYNY